jgi:hypothetical protein
LRRKPRRIIVEDKCVEKLTVPMIRETKDKYRYPWFPDQMEIHIPFRTKVPENVKEYAREKKVRIARIPVYRKHKRPVYET